MDYYTIRNKIDMNKVTFIIYLIIILLIFKKL